MLDKLRRSLSYLPSLLLAFILAVVVWVAAITASDPLQDQILPNTIPIEIIGQDPTMVITSPLPSQLTLTLRAPQSIWQKIINQQIPIRAIVDISGLEAGEHIVNVQVQIGITPVEVISYSPNSISVTLEKIASRTLPIHLIQRGQPAVGYQVDTATLSQSSVTIVGPESLVKQVQDVRANLELNNAADDITRTLNLLPIDASDQIIQGINLSPETVTATIMISQRGGYRNVVVKIQVVGNVADGYRLTNITVYPPAVTVFSADPQLVEDLPGFIETIPLDLNNAKDDFELYLTLNLPQGILIFGDQNVLVQVGVAAIEGSITLTNLPVEIIGLSPGFTGTASPDRVDVIITGPLPLLDALLPENVHVVIEMNGEIAGIYKRTPRVDITIPELISQSILPETIEITVIELLTPTPGGTIIPSPTPTRTPHP
jgi:YbbR domain-containing protein